MTGNFTHNGRLPLPEQVLPLNPRAIMLDGVEELSMGSAVGFWTPTEDHCHTYVENGYPLVPTEYVPEAFNQLAAYVLMHGLKEPKTPVLTGADQIRARHVVRAGETVQVKVEVTPGKRTYRAHGEIVKQEVPEYSRFRSQVAYWGVVRGVLLGEGETWSDDEDKGIVVARRGGNFGREAGNTARRERIEPDRTHELYKRIVDLDRIPAVEGTEDRPKVDLSIEADNELAVDGRVIHLTPDRTFVLNALLMNLDREITRAEVEEMGFHPRGSVSARQVAFSNAKSNLQRSLLTADNRKILLQRMDHGRKGYYQLDPANNYVFYDRRQQPER